LLLAGPEVDAEHEFELWRVASADKMEEQPLHSLILRSLEGNKDTRCPWPFDRSGRAIGSKECNRRNMVGLVDADLNVPERVYCQKRFTLADALRGSPRREKKKRNP
jgi:hypothetical protein